MTTRNLLAIVLGIGMITPAIHASAAEISLSDNLIPLAGEWVQTDGVWQTGADSPPAGWYLRAENQYDMESLAFQVRKEKDDGILYLYTKDWRIIFRPHEVVVKYAGEQRKSLIRYWVYYQYTATRPIQFPAGTWQTFRLQLDGQYLTLSQNGAEILKWNSPQEEWFQRVKATGKIKQIDQYQFPEKLPDDALAGKDQVIVFHSLYSGAAIRDVRVSGTDTGLAKGFAADTPGLPDALAAQDEADDENAVFVLHDWEIARLSPTEPVVVDWPIPASAKAKAAALPPVGEWGFARDQVQDPKEDSPAEQEFLIGKDNGAKFPQSLYPHFRVKKTQKAKVYFNLDKAGDYTLETSWGSFGMGWGPNVLQISVDGRPVSREVYRGLSQNGACPEGFDYVPLRLAAGPHCVEYALDLTNFKVMNFRMKSLRLLLGSVALVPGIHEPLWTRKAGKSSGPTQSAKALADPISTGEVYGKVLRYRIEGLSPELTYKISLGFHEIDVNQPGKRLMDIYLNGTKVDDGLDVFKEAGWAVDFHRTYESHATATGKTSPAIEIRLVGRNFKAFLNHLKIETPDGRSVFEENCGWTAQMNQRAIRRLVTAVTPALATETVPASAAPWTEKDIFDGHNLVANPHFSLRDDVRNRPAHWYSGPELVELTRAKHDSKAIKNLGDKAAELLRKAQFEPNLFLHYNLLQGEGSFELDPVIGHDRPGALKITKAGKDFGIFCTMPVVDYGKTQAFRFHAKIAGAKARVYPEILWFAMSMDADMKYYAQGGKLQAPRLQFLGRNAGEALTGDTDWTELTVRAKPPLGTIYAMPVVRVEDLDGGTVWVDDAELNGYGDEPLEVTTSHLGYHPQGDKQIVIKSLVNAPVDWTLVEAATGTAVQSGKAVYLEYEWFSKRYYFRADVPPVEREGDYRLVAIQGARKVESVPFAISRTVYRELSRVMLNGLWIKRMNCEIPGAHEAECMEDAYTPNSERPGRFNMFEKLLFPGRRDLLGGYYDAGDMIKHVEFWPTVLLALQEMTHDIQPPLQNRGKDDARDEMLWAYKAFVKFQLPDGSFILSTKPQGYATDNIPYYAVDRATDQTLYLRQAAGICGMAALDLQSTDPALSRKYLDAALLAYNNPGYWKELEKPESLATVGSKEVSLAAKCLLAEGYLYKLTNDPIYPPRIERHAAILAKGLKNRAYHDLLEMFCASDVDANALQDCAWAPVQFLRLYPDHPAKAELEDGLRAFAKHVAELSATTVWGQALAMNTPDGQPADRYPCGFKTRPGGYWPMLAFSLSQIGVQLRDREIILLAERQLQWCLGKNFADLCMVNGIGNRFIAGGDFLYRQAEFFNSWLAGDKKLFYYEGNVPKTVFRNIGDGTVKIQKGDDYVSPLSGYPLGYCAMPVVPDYPMHPGVCENYLPHTAQFTLAATGVYAALEWLEKQKGVK